MFLTNKLSNQLHGSRKFCQRGTNVDSTCFFFFFFFFFFFLGGGGGGWGGVCLFVCLLVAVFGVFFCFFLLFLLVMRGGRINGLSSVRHRSAIKMADR